MKKDKSLELAERLLAELPPQANRQPRLTGMGWMIYWRPDPGRADHLCVGVAFLAHDAISCKLASDEELTRLSNVLLPIQRAHITTLLDAVDVRLRRGDTTAPAGIYYDAPREVRGDSVAEIVEMLWHYGPALLSQQTLPQPMEEAKYTASKRKTKV